MSNLPTADSGALVVAQNVHKTYKVGAGTLEVLRGIDLSVQPGEFVALCGASGAGKSTLLHLLGGLDIPNEGDVFFAGKNLRLLSNAELSRLRNTRVGLVFQSYHLLPELNALENVVLPARMARRSVDESETVARELLTRVGLGARLDHRPYELSGGEQQRVAIARALVNKPLLLLADEPTGNLDSRTGEEIFQLLCELRTDMNLTLIVATHDLRMAARAQRVVELADGRPVAK
jgi:predicted ABC-type transport system involved in lysophospholipase L1 biosynthesis ATPase subunit